MNLINFSKFLSSIALLLFMMLIPLIIKASPINSVKLSPSEHKQIIRQFISEINEAQNRSTHIAQDAIKTSSINNNELKMQIDEISANLQALNQRIEDYANIIQGLNEQDRQVRLAFNYLNLTRSNLATLTDLINATSSVEKIQLIDEYYRIRLNAIDTLSLLEDLINKYND